MKNLLKNRLITTFLLTLCLIGSGFIFNTASAGAEPQCCVEMRKIVVEEPHYSIDHTFCSEHDDCVLSYVDYSRVTKCENCGAEFRRVPSGMKILHSSLGESI